MKRINVAEGFSLPNKENPYFPTVRTICFIPTGKSTLPYADMIDDSTWLGLNEVEGLTIKQGLLNEVSGKVQQSGRARCPTYEKTMSHIPVGGVHPEGSP